MTVQRLREVAQRQLDAEKAVEDATEALKTAKENLRRISEEELPNLMDELGFEEFRLGSGLYVTLDTGVHSTITEANNEKAMAWLREHNHGKIIKSLVAVSVKGDADRTLALKALTAAGFAKGSIASKDTVHHMTLGKFVRDTMKAGVEDIPFDLFSITPYRVTKIKEKDA